MTILKSYSPLKGYLERWTIFRKGRLHVRLHYLKKDDCTPFLHSHPFSYISLILKGGYTETLEHKDVMHKRFSLIFRNAKTFHRLKKVDPNTLTFFIAWSTKDKKWDLKNIDLDVPGWTVYDPGIYIRRVNGKLVYSKFDNHWKKGSTCFETAGLEEAPSIDQSTEPLKKC